MAGFYTQKITSGEKTQVTYDYNSYKSMTFTNTHTSAVSITLYVTSQLGSDITDTTINVIGATAVSSSSVTISVDNTVPTNDLVLNERIYKSDGTFIGVATGWTDASPDTIVFSGGIVNAIANNDDLYTGTRYTMLKSVEIPVGAALKLEPSDFEFDNDSYNMYIDSSNASGYIDIITRY